MRSQELKGTKNRFGDWMVSDTVANKVIKKHCGTNPCTPSHKTWPAILAPGKSASRYRDVTLKQRIAYIIKYERRKRWQELKALLGPVYLENIRRECLYTQAA